MISQIKSRQLLRLSSIVIGIVVASAISFATKPPCVSDANPCGGGYVENGHGCSTYSGEPPYVECCFYREFRCMGTQIVWRKRSGWIFGDSCTDGVCPLYSDDEPGGGGGSGS